ncbi:hypothetical protein K7432_013690 [Basidiobolus ranarum]|uniref:Uncharacterized protein n=1 Tax=Basidiobolus ranarum TaxID=34480 RepID=A0ABR2WIT3_9FUNG
MNSNPELPNQVTIRLPLLYESNMMMAVIAMVTTVFINNTYHALKLVIENRKPIYYLCFSQALLGAIANVTLILLFFQFNFMCEMRMYTVAVMNLLSTTCIETILLVKAYYCSESSYPVLSYGMILGFARFSVGLAHILFTKVLVTPLFTCANVVNTTTVFLVVAVEISLNLYLSACFLFSVYNQWKCIRTKLYSTLLQDGTVYSIATSFTSIVIMIFVLLHILGDNSSVLLNISCKFQYLYQARALRIPFSSRDSYQYFSGAVSSKLTVEQLLRTQGLKKSGLPRVHAINIHELDDFPRTKMSKSAILRDTNTHLSSDQHDLSDTHLNGGHEEDIQLSIIMEDLENCNYVP